jgi:putative Ca2+/H+ antiporter (TMEM165/GDT1 family)
VFAGQLVGSRIDPRLLSRLAGLGFIAIGVWTFVRA